MVVVEDPVSNHLRIGSDLRWIVRQQEDQDPAGIVVNVIILDQRVDRVLDLAAGHIVVDPVAPDDDVS